MKEIKPALTYDDVLIVPKKTYLSSRTEADTKTKITRNISLNIPIVSANMVSVTEHKMAIAVARAGGIGIIHQFNSIEEQLEEIKKVKKSTSHVIENPIVASPDISIKEAIEKMKKENVTSLLVVQNESLMGIFTSRDYLFEEDLSKPISQLMTPREDMITAEFGISLEQAKRILHTNRIEKLPLIENNKIKGLITTQDIKKLEYWPEATRDKKGRLRVGAAIGVKDCLERTKALIDVGVDLIVLDVAHGHSEQIIRRLKEIKSIFNIDILVGNIVTSEAAEDLIKAGADGLKVGVGPSPVCTTRIISGSGMPQITAIMNVYEVAKKYNVPVCADGGIRYPGDISKAIGAGADTVMIGSLLAGTDESPGIIINKDGRKYKRYFGSASYESNHERKERDQKSKIKEKIDVFVEGVTSLVDYKGSAEEVINALVKGVKSGISYAGVSALNNMKGNVEFMQVTESGLEEGKARGNKLIDS